MVEKKNIMKIPSQPWQHNAFKFGITFLIVISSIWSASGLEITLERILDAPRHIGILVGAGGVGRIIETQRIFLRFDRISPIVVLILVVVIGIEQFSVWLRRKIL